jgi:kinesin family protein 1
MLEIYNEQVRDLLSRDNPKGGLKVRNIPKLGVQVVGLSEVPVVSYEDIELKMEEGTSSRWLASTAKAYTRALLSFFYV